jgi:hypothetical protein
MKKIVEHLAATLGAMGQEMSDAALEIMARDLAPYAERDVVEALARCRRELRRLVLADVLDRMPGGHLGAEEAWSICAGCLNNEHLSVVWTDEMSRAFGAALGLQEDTVAARMAFKEAYAREVAQARLHGKRPRWWLSPGFDKSARELALLDAMEKGRIGLEYARNCLPYHREDEGLNARLLSLAEQSVRRLTA